MKCPSCNVQLERHETKTGGVRHIVYICPECGATYTERPQPARGREGR